MERSQINLDKFFERDIIQFLDSKVEKIAGEEKETIFQQTETALKKNDADTVINIFEDLTNKYNSITKDDAYKTLIFSDILELIELAKKHLPKLDRRSELAGIITELSENEEMKEGELPDIITAFHKIKMDRAKRKLIEEEKLYKTQTQLEKERQRISKELFINIRKKKLAESISNYKELKAIFEKYPSSFDEKEEFYNDILSFYMQIKRMREDLSSRKSSVTTSSPAPKEQKKISASNIKEIMFQIKQDVNKGDFNSAKAKIIELKHISSRIKDKHIKGLLDSKINTLNQNIDFIKRAAEHKT